MSCNYDPDLHSGQVIAAAMAYAFRCAADAMPLAPHYDRFVRMVGRAFMIPALIYNGGAYYLLSSRLVYVVERAYRSALFSVGSPNYRVPDVARLDSEFVRALARAFDHADLFYRTAQFLPYRPYVSERLVQYLQNHVYLVARPGAKDPFIGLQAIDDEDPLVVDIFRKGYFRVVNASPEGGGAVDEA